MARFLIIGALALDRPIRLNAPLARGGRVGGRSLEGRLAARLGGGGANAGVALRKAGHEVWVAAVAAQDADGDDVLARAAAAGLDVSLCVRRPGVSRSTLILIEPDGERLVMSLDSERGAFVPPALPDPAGTAAPRFDAVFVRAAYGGAGAWADRSGGPVVLHWPSLPYEGRADIVVASADDLPPESLADPLAAARAQAGPQVRWAVITRGADGARAHGDSEQIDGPRAAAPVIDATGAGDIFAAGLMEALSAGADMAAALVHASAWGAAAVGLEASAPVEADPALFPAFTFPAISQGPERGTSA